MVSLGGLMEIAIETILIFGAFFVIGTFLRAQAMGGHAGKMLIFVAIVALVGGLTGAYFFPHTPGGARLNQSATHR